jgi:predicted transcriptional regulator
MGKTTITFRLDADKREGLDTIAKASDRDRTYILNEAIDAYLDVHHWQIEHFEKGLRQAKARQFATEAEVRKAFERCRR